MMPLVINMDKQNVCEELIQDFTTAQFHEHINRNTTKRKHLAAQEAQSRATAAKRAERVRNTRVARKWRSVRNLAGTAAVIGVLAYAYATFQISVPLFHITGFIASVSFGWCLNSTFRQFCRKHSNH